jgi:hypothetical protein
MGPALTGRGVIDKIDLSGCVLMAREFSFDLFDWMEGASSIFESSTLNFEEEDLA